LLLFLHSHLVYVPSSSFAIPFGFLFNPCFGDRRRGTHNQTGFFEGLDLTLCARCPSYADANDGFLKNNRFFTSLTHTTIYPPRHQRHSQPPSRTPMPSYQKESTQPVPSPSRPPPCRVTKIRREKNFLAATVWTL
jgi:hypothetical protein